MSMLGTSARMRFGQFHLALGRRAKREAVQRGLLHGLQHGRVAVAQDHRAPGADVVDVALAVGVPEVGALRTVHKARGAAHGLEGAHGEFTPPGITFGALNRV